jgi:addiction module RelE/StbE family toxin
VRSIRWSRPAAADFRELIARIHADNPRAARRIAERIKQRVSELIAMPRMGRSGRVKDTRELVISGSPYLIIYELFGDDEDVVVLRILHGRRAWPPR